MLRELIYALNGYHGEVFCWNEESKTVNVAEGLPFIQPSEHALLERLCRLASYFIKFKTFVQDTLEFSFVKPTSTTSKPPPGIYMKAFARALDAYLQSYQRKMVVLERMVVQDACVGLATLHSHTQQFQNIFPVIANIIDNILVNKLQGCIILDVLYKASKTGLNEVKPVVSRMLQMCNVVFYKHLALWMMHGKLPNNLNNNKKDNNNKDDDEFIITNVKMDGPDNDVADGDNNRSNAAEEREALWVTYEVNVGQLPSFVSLSLAERILFVGQSVVLFESGKEECGVGRSADECLIPEERQRYFKAQLAGLGSEAGFEAFEDTVQNIRNHVAQQLYVLIVEKCDLQSQLKRFKDFFLIGRGELFLTFIDQSQNLLRNPPNNATQYDVNLAFEHACRDVMVDEKHKKAFSLLIKPEEVAAATASSSSSSFGHKAFLKGRKSGWACLQMTASVDWPLHVLFTQPIIDKYNTLFSFLLHAKRMQQQLQHCWSLQRRCRRSPLNATKWRLRNHMAFFIDNLQYYLQVDVIESQYGQLTHKLSQHRDFEQVLLNHQTFLHSLTQQCFLYSKQIHACLSSIFDLCQAYYGLVVYSSDDDDDDDGGAGNDTLHRRLKEIDEAFRKQSTLLFEMLSSNARRSNHLSLLLLRIDYNRYFSSIAT